MKGLKANKFMGYLLLAVGIMFMTQACNASKNCGCGSDLNKVYRAPKHYRH